ncbi:MAG: hypothetical protein A3A44_03515 [Candidatus Sungbacteria bacterium RIFCSPLOWO2_01_FULL_60_25]|uniref:Zinc finger CHC2-type domain-containing protein n=1 Tax=Candidatus Sungbacteria bacterium RIFCSPLOWO2_01_FULL_60_25 TaxID=1802281 RepID=A0A1G2LCH7_9BACT|nr:MAG: hypothetical protein A3A44_03515 [Candidatus Sungbacteria bacterium RIFCSPLOWO2_01_FULL_60_25]
MNLDSQPAEQYHAALPRPIRAYLNNRGIPDPVIDRAQIGWNGARITIPVYDRDDQLALFKLGKSPDDMTDSPKMVYYPPGVRAELYGWDAIRGKPTLLVVCEGEYDRLVLEAQGFPAVTGTGGAGVFREEWAHQLRAIPAVYVCFDNDDAGRAGAERVGRLIPTARIVNLPPETGPGGDVSDFFVRLHRTATDFRALLQDAQPLPVTPRPDSRPHSRPTACSTPSDVGRLKQAIRIEEVMAQYVTLRPSGQALMARCCFHEDHDPSLAVFRDTQSFYCFGCQTHGDVITFLMKVEHLSFREAVRLLNMLVPVT